MAALSLMTPLYYPPHEPVYKGSPLPIAICAITNISRAVPHRWISTLQIVPSPPSTYTPDLIPLSAPSRTRCFCFPLPRSPSLSHDVPRSSRLTENVATRASNEDCTQSAANWEMIGGASADSIAPLTTLAAQLYNR